MKNRERTETGQVREKWLRVRVTEKELEQIKAKAKGAGRTVSSYVMERLLKEK